jgi:enamine deaminase RidA (YjgF/YER057c/UK114 family)
MKAARAKKCVVKHRAFRRAGGSSEHFIFVAPGPAGSFQAQAAAAAAGYAGALRDLGLRPDSAVFRRLFLDGAPGRAGGLARGPLLSAPGEGPVALSLLTQPPLNGGKLALLAYHVQGAAPLPKRRLGPGHLALEAGGLRHIWSAGLRGPAGKSPGRQTAALFAGLSDRLRRGGGSLRGNCVRTWLYLRDIDRDYGEMVAARRAAFRRLGLTRRTHYIASTGIEGSPAGSRCLVGLDAYSVLGLRRRQVSYLNDFSRLCRTADYNVTFERGTRVAYADRAHYFISGTASIDKAGNILHPGDAARQLGRALGNLEALLKAGGAGLCDLMYLIVYLREPADYPRVEGILKKKFPGLPVAAVRGAVCRPGWLVEIEGVAVAGFSGTGLPRF